LKQFIFAPDKVFSTIWVRIYEFTKIIKPEENALVVNSSNRKPTISAVDPDSRSSCLSIKKDYEELYSSKQIRVRLEIIDSRHNTLIYEADFFNQILIPNVIFEGEPVSLPDTKKSILSTQNSNPYTIRCYLYAEDFSESLPKEIGWNIRVFSSDTLGFVKDSKKEDEEKALVESWEQGDPGRAEKAKKSRIKFLAQIKKQNGETLAKEEEEILTEPRERRKSMESGGATMIRNDEKNPTKKIMSKKTIVENRDTSNRGKSIKVMGEVKENILQKPLINLDKPLPKPEKHTSSYIKNFLNYSNQSRTIVFDNKVPQEESKC
jgi:hypothetical protein